MPRHHELGPHTTESRLDEAVIRLNAGDQAARNDLIGHVRHRLMAITRGRLRGSGGFKQVARWNETDDVVQEACLRLDKTLQQEPITSGDHFLRLAAIHIKRALVNMHKHVNTQSHYSAKLEEGPARVDDGGPDGRLALARARTDTLFRWDKFLDHFKTLTAEQRQMLDDVFFNGCTKQEAADRLKIGITAFKDRWRSLKLQLADEGFAPFN